MKTYYIKADSMKDAIDKYRSLRSKADRRDDDEDIKSAMSTTDWDDEDDTLTEPSADARGTEADDDNWDIIDEPHGDVEEDDIDVAPVDEEGNEVAEGEEVNPDDVEEEPEHDEPEETEASKPEKNPRVDELCEAIMANEQFECESAAVVGPNKVECVGGPMTSDCPKGTKWYAVIDMDGSIMTYVDCDGVMKDFSVYTPEEAEKQFFGE